VSGASNTTLRPDPLLRPRRSDALRASCDDFELPASSQHLSSPTDDVQQYARPTDTLGPSAAPFNDVPAAQTAVPHDFFSFFDTPHTATSPAAEPSGTLIGTSRDLVSILPGAAFAMHWNDHARVVQPSPHLTDTSSYSRPESHTALRSQPATRPLGAMSVRQELQAVKDDLGLPSTRDVSRNASPDCDTEAGASRWSECGRPGAVPACELDVLSLMTAGEVEFLFDK
jgi:hypothetical protein